MKNWMVILRKDNVTELKGVYSTKRAAQFISIKVKVAEKLNQWPKVVPTEADIYPPNNRVEDYLKLLDSRKNVIPHRKNVRDYLPTYTEQ